jgi:diguanylate cyclase (GGDEF)-like protein/PAS domain S-box-containing protein
VLVSVDPSVPPFWQGVFLDVTERHAAEEALRRSEERFRTFVQNAADVITVTDAQGIITYESPAIEAVLGLDATQTVGTHIFAPLHIDDRARASEYLASVLAVPGRHPAIELCFAHTDGTWRYLEMRATNLLDDTTVNGVVFNTHDATERHLFEEQLEHQAFYDALTGLPNRSLLIDRIEHGLARIRRTAGELGIIFLDLDRFKVINDSLGHAAGDRLLVMLGQRLNACLRSGDTVARLGGDEFIVLLEDVVSVEDVTAIADRIIAALREPFDLDGHDAFVAASMGIVLSGEAATAAADSGELLRHADVALYRAKGMGRGQYVIFDPSMNVFSAERLSLESDLQRAIERGELRLHFQPEVDLLTGDIIGVEALARWQHGQRGLIPPADFIPLAEETGLVIPIGEWVLREACRQARTWLDDWPGRPPLTVSVNLSARQFQQEDLIGQIRAALHESGLPPEQLRLEITESVVIQEAGAARETLQRLKELGVRIAIDDFGTGYSSLAYLTRLLADTLKVDRSFVASIGKDERALAIVGAVASLAHALGMNVTAEGIETAEQLDHVRSSGCDNGQGYHFSRPLPADEITRLFLRRCEGVDQSWER